MKRPNFYSAWDKPPEINKELSAIDPLAANIEWLEEMNRYRIEVELHKMMFRSCMTGLLLTLSHLLMELFNHLEIGVEQYLMRE